MKKSFSSIMIIIGTVIGSGFASGKEVAVFFSRFGKISYFFIVLSFFLFYGLIYFFLSKGSKALERLSKSKIFSLLCLFVSLIFSSSMFAGTINILPSSVLLKILLLAVIVIICAIVACKGINSLGFINSILIPTTIFCMIYVLFSNFKDISFATFNQNGFAGLLFTILYAVLNFSISGVVIAKTGEMLTKKQKAIVSFVSSFLLSSFLMLTNFILLSNPDAIRHDMPLVYISSGLANLFISFVIFSGCITTLFSLVWTSRLALKRLGVSLKWSIVISVFMPLSLSMLGFGSIVSYLYPLASIIGIGILLLIFTVPVKNH